MAVIRETGPLEDAAATVDFNALDQAIIAALFISYGVLALFQLGNLFAGRYLRFAAIAVVTGAAALVLPAIAPEALCAARPSAIVCNNGAEALASLLFVWVYLSAGALALFGYVRGLKVLARE